MSSLLSELIAASKIDGAGELRIFWSIIMPLSLPGMAALLGIFTVINSECFSLAAGRPSCQYNAHAAVGLATVQSEYHPEYGLIMAGLVLTVLPLLVLYLLFQPYFVEGLRMGYGKTQRAHTSHNENLHHRWPQINTDLAAFCVASVSCSVVAFRRLCETYFPPQNRFAL
ncbi:MAG: ABC transporter permease subunit [Caldilineaceae bacterium]